MLKLSLVKNEDDEERKEEQEVVNFVTGNPRVETLSGSLHLYRTSSCSSIETTRGSMVCLVDVPPHMAPIEILEFTNEFRSDIVLIRILKDPDMQRYMALLDMKTEDRALAFYSVSFIKMAIIYLSLTIALGFQWTSIQFNRTRPL